MSVIFPAYSHTTQIMKSVKRDDKMYRWRFFCTFYCIKADLCSEIRLFGCDVIHFIELATTKSDKTSNESPFYPSTINIFYCFIFNEHFPIWCILFYLLADIVSLMFKRTTFFFCYWKMILKSLPLKMNFPQGSKMWQKLMHEKSAFINYDSAIQNFEKLKKKWIKEVENIELFYFENDARFIFMIRWACLIQKMKLLSNDCRHPLIMFYPLFFVSSIP